MVNQWNLSRSVGVMIMKKQDRNQAVRRPSNRTYERFVIVFFPSLFQSAAALCVHVGSFSDPIEAQGLAHFLEHSNVPLIF